MFDAAIEVGIAVFLAHRSDSDEELRAKLRRTGVADWLAQRLVLFLPITFGRRLLAGATLSEMLADGSALRPLADEPVFIAASRRAQRASREEVEVIGLRSSEVNAVNAALRAGSRLEDLHFSPVTLVSPLVSAAEGDGGIPSPCDFFRQFLAAHGHAATVALEVDARVFPRLNPNSMAVQVDFAVCHPALAVPRLLQSFAGWGPTWRDAIGQTVAKFERASLHPLIAGLLDRASCADQVSWERLDHPGGAFDICIGPQLVLYAKGPVPDLGPLVDSVKLALRDVALSRATHALRLYVCWNADELRSREALLDNEPWAAGEELIAAFQWPRVEGWWGSRLFLLAIPV